MKIWFKNSARAFTLIEVMVAMLVLAIGLLGLAGITVVVLRSNTLSQQISEATTISADLMDTLKRQPVGNLRDCPTANSYTTATIPASPACSILRDSGVLALGDNYMPVIENGDALCGISGVLSAGNSYTYDNVASNFVVLNNYPNDADICTNPAAADNLAPHSYIRYYRTFQTPIPPGNTGDRTIVVVVLWKDRFGRWRNVHLSTSRTN